MTNQTTSNSPDHEHVLDTLNVDLGFDLSDGINTNIDADRTLYALHNIDSEIEREKEFKQEAEAFYNKKIAQKQKAKDFLKDKLLGYLYFLEVNGHDAKASTPHGTAFVQKKRSPVWANDDTLIEWAKDNAPHTVKVTEKPDKAKLKEILKDENSDLLHYESQETLSIRKPKKDPKPDNPSEQPPENEEFSIF